MLYTWSVMVTIFSFQGYLLTTIPLSFLAPSLTHICPRKKPEHASHWSATLGHAQVKHLTKTKGLPLTDHPTPFSRDEAQGLSQGPQGPRRTSYFQWPADPEWHFLILEVTGGAREAPVSSHEPQLAPGQPCPLTECNPWYGRAVPSFKWQAARLE